MKDEALQAEFVATQRMKNSEFQKKESEEFEFLCVESNFEKIASSYVEEEIKIEKVEEKANISEDSGRRTTR